MNTDMQLCPISVAEAKALRSVDFLISRSGKLLELDSDERNFAKARALHKALNDYLNDLDDKLSCERCTDLRCFAREAVTARRAARKEE